MYENLPKIEKMYERLVKQFHWGGFNNSSLYFDENAFAYLAQWIAAVKRGMDSSVREDINNTTMEKFKDYIEMTEALTMQQRIARGRVAKRTAKKRCS